MSDRRVYAEAEFNDYTTETPTLTDDEWKRKAEQYPNTHGFVPCPDTPGMFVRQIETGEKRHDELCVNVQEDQKEN